MAKVKPILWGLAITALGFVIYNKVPAVRRVLGGQ